MRKQPVPGWKTTLAQLGVPGPGKIATNSDPGWSTPFVGGLGDRAYFVASGPSAQSTQWWLTGISVHDGRPLFPPAPLSTEQLPPHCFLNGPDSVFCLRNDTHAVTAWVIDAHSGKILFIGPTDLRVYPPTLTVRQVGIYAVAETNKQGVHGIGPHAETTWFVRGDGTVHEKDSGTTNVAPLTVATQTAADRGSDGRVVFSLSDGHVIKPETDGDSEQQSTLVYPGGFAAEIRSGGRLSVPKVEFFNDSGKRTSRVSVAGEIVTSVVGKPDLPIIESNTPNNWAVFTPEGGKLLEVSGDAPAYSLLIGSRLFVQEPANGAERHWQQYDLQTGAKGRACEADMLGYIGSDGAVAVLKNGNANIGLVTKAIDLQTCDTLWTLRSEGSFRNVWRVGATLVQLSDDGTQLMSLVAPG